MKNSKFIHRIQHLPVAATGLSLGFCGMATVSDTIFSQFYASKTDWWISIPLISIALFLLILMTIRNVTHPKVVKSDAREPLISSLLPTYSMTLMCVGGFFAGWQKGQSGIPPLQVLGAVLMCIAVLIQFVLIFTFIKNILSKYNFNQDVAYGSWLVPTVGICTACTFAGRFNQNILPNAFFQAIWYFAFVTYILLFVVITYALLFKKRAEAPKFPSIAVYFAPPNLILAGFMQTFAIPTATDNANIVNELLVYGGNQSQFIFVLTIILSSMAFTYTIILWFFIIKVFFNHKYSYVFASFTFPLAIGSAGMLFVSKYFTGLYNIQGGVYNDIFVQTLSSFYLYVGYIYSSVAAICVLYIAFRFFKELYIDLCTNKYDEVHHHAYGNKTCSEQIEETKE